MDLEDGDIQYKIGHFFFELELFLDGRYNYTYLPLRGENHDTVLKSYGVNIETNEILYYQQNRIDWYEENTISTNVTYSGFRSNSGGAISFNTGSFNVVRDNVTGFVLLDRGHLFLTNKRIIFIGGESRQNRSIALENILEFELFKDGVIIGKPNGKKPLILFPMALKTLVQPDGLNPFLRILDRLLSGNENLDLTPLEFKKG